jgi:hypothetical protein
MAMRHIDSFLDGKSRVKRDGKFIRVLDDKHCVKHGDVRILEVLSGLTAHYFKTWAFPTQEKICELLYRFTGRRMSVRTLNRHLNAHERDYFLHRKRRHEKERGKKDVTYRSTLYYIRPEFLKRIMRIAEVWQRWNLGEKFIADLKGELRSGIHLPSLAHHGNHSILRL